VKIVWSEIRARAELTTRDTLDAHAFAQPVALSQAIVALLQNAAQSIPSDRRGHIDISIVESNGEAAITISDDGVGIDPDVMPRVFDPFFTTKRTGDGAGLGLSLARRRIERMGGTLELTSAPECGTTARIRLPLFAFQVVAQ
jgi:signal transduction histidine kinase